MKMNRVELLSPVGNFDSLKKAVHNGCDAVYLAGKKFGARAFANNFSNEELKSSINYAHSYGVKVYVTVNTIIFESEMQDVLDFIDFLYLNNVDAVIVQDIGLASIIKKRYPGLELHASTQMNCQTLEEVVTLKKLGFNRVVLGREVCLQEIKRIKENCDIEIEVFIHGALCISYSGNCLMSSLIGSRSGNRGKCAQPCRMEYTYKGEKKYYLSTKDLCTISELKDIIPYVDSLKIEGRMKNPAYVGVVTNNYRRLIDDYYVGKKADLKQVNFELKTVFNREFTKGFINSEKNKDITNVRTQNHLGTLIGEVVGNNRKGFANIKLRCDIVREDCIRITSKNDESIVKDVVIINEIFINKNLVREAKAGNIITIKVHEKLDIGDKVFLTKSVTLDNKYNSEKKIPIDGKCYLDGEVIVLELSDGTNKAVNKIAVQSCETDFSVRVKEQLNKTNDTIFTFRKLEVSELFCFTQIKNINELRRNSLHQLYEMRFKDYDRSINFKYSFKNKNSIYNNKCNIERRLNIAISTLEQFEALENISLEEYNLYVRDYSLYKKIRGQRKNVYYYLPRINRKYEENVMTSNYKNLKNSIVSPYLNVTNSYAVHVLEELGAQGVCLSLEMNKEEIENLIRNCNEINGSQSIICVMIYGHIQAMIMKHCFINKAEKQEKMNCNLCKNGFITDRKGVDYPVMKDENCNLSILYNKPICLFTKLKELEKIGVSSFLIDFTIESKEDVLRILTAYNSRKSDGIDFFGHYLNDDL